MLGISFLYHVLCQATTCADSEGGREHPQQRPAPPAAVVEAARLVWLAEGVPCWTISTLLLLLEQGIRPSFNHLLVLLGADPLRMAGWGSVGEQAAVAALFERLRTVVPHLFVREGLRLVITPG